LRYVYVILCVVFLPLDTFVISAKSNNKYKSKRFIFSANLYI